MTRGSRDRFEAWPVWFQTAVLWAVLALVVLALIDPVLNTVFSPPKTQKEIYGTDSSLTTDE